MNQNLSIRNNGFKFIYVSVNEHIIINTQNYIHVKVAWSNFYLYLLLVKILKMSLVKAM